jgi:hypothetical protein
MPSLLKEVWPEVGGGAMNTFFVVSSVERSEHSDEFVQAPDGVAWKLSMCPFFCGV